MNISWQSINLSHQAFLCLKLKILFKVDQILDNEVINYVAIFIVPFEFVVMYFKGDLRNRKYIHMKSHLMTFIFRQLACIGGNSLTNKVEIYSFELDTWTPYSNDEVGLRPSRFVGFITAHKSLYFMGPLDLLTNSYIRDIYIFDADNGTARAVGSL